VSFFNIFASTLKCRGRVSSSLRDDESASKQTKMMAAPDDEKEYEDSNIAPRSSRDELQVVGQEQINIKG
jgi:hypothetical protein